MPRSTLRTELVGLLRKSHKVRLPRSRGTARKRGLPNKTNISLHPPEVAARSAPGHWVAARPSAPCRQGRFARRQPQAGTGAGTWRSRRSHSRAAPSSSSGASAPRFIAVQPPVVTSAPDENEVSVIVE
jgi:hypothetical protein